MIIEVEDSWLLIFLILFLFLLTEHLYFLIKDLKNRVKVKNAFLRYGINAILILLCAVSILAIPNIKKKFIEHKSSESEFSKNDTCINFENKIVCEPFYSKDPQIATISNIRKLSLTSGQAGKFYCYAMDEKGTVIPTSIKYKYLFNFFNKDSFSVLITRCPDNRSLVSVFPKTNSISNIVMFFSDECPVVEQVLIEVKETEETKQ